MSGTRRGGNAAFGGKNSRPDLPPSPLMRFSVKRLYRAAKELGLNPSTKLKKEELVREIERAQPS